jgi:hypothetical protein
VPLDPWNARQALAIALAAVESSQTGKVVQVNRSAGESGGAA